MTLMMIREELGETVGEKSNLDQTLRVGAFKEDKKCVKQIRKYLKVKVIQ